MFTSSTFRFGLARKLKRQTSHSLKIPQIQSHDAFRAKMLRCARMEKIVKITASNPLAFGCLLGGFQSLQSA